MGVVVFVDDVDVAIVRGAIVDVAGIATVSAMRLRDGVIRNRIERKGSIGGVIDAVALVGKVEDHSLLCLRTVDDDVRKAERSVRRSVWIVPTEIGMQASSAAADECDER